MITRVLPCPDCQGTDIVRHGKSPEGKQRYRCRQCREGHGTGYISQSSPMANLPGYERRRGGNPDRSEKDPHLHDERRS